MINVGTFKHRISVQEPVDSVVNGFQKTEWVEIASKKACVRALSLRKQELFKDKGIQVTELREFTMRKVSCINHNMRIAWDENHWNIIGIDDIGGQGVFHMVLCERVSDG